MFASQIERKAGEIRTILGLSDLLWKASCPGRVSWTEIPDLPGVYCVHLPGGVAPAFSASAGRARHAKPQCPDRLREKQGRILANGPTDILYIGKAGATRSTLRKRVRQLVRFGLGLTAKHRGGEWMWQIRNCAETQILMQTCPRDETERLESRLLARFRNEHGEWPLANRTG